MTTIGTPFMWAGFLVFIFILLALDLGLFNRTAHKINLREALIWSVVWISLALLFNGLIWMWFGPTKALEFLTGYLIEKALSVDNLFVFVVIFSYFNVPEELQHRVLFWGIVGALVFRIVFITVGAVLLQMFSWLFYVLGGVLIVTGLKLFFENPSDVQPDKKIIIKIFRRFFPITNDYHQASFFIVQGKRLVATPLFLALLTIEVTDIIFAIDSIPAIFAVATDPFLVFTSNIFAILGLRSLYFAIAHALERFHFLRFGLAFILIFVGGKMLLGHFFVIPIYLSLGVIISILAISLIASMMFPRSPKI